MIGYGTFITNQTYSEAKQVFVCKLRNYRRLWFGTTIYPFIIPDKEFAGLHALCFTLDKERLPSLDKYEGVEAGLYTREEIEVELESGDFCQAFIYIPTQKCINEYELTSTKDPNDSWMNEIKKTPEIGDKFPKLLDYLN